MQIKVDERRIQRPAPDRKTPGNDEDGPTKPEIERPQLPDELMRRMEKVDKDRAKNYRQRSGQ